MKLWFAVEFHISFLKLPATQLRNKHAATSLRVVLSNERRLNDDLSTPQPPPEHPLKVRASSPAAVDKKQHTEDDILGKHVYGESWENAAQSHC
jgi:hypothetical protein